LLHREQDLVDALIAESNAQSATASEWMTAHPQCATPDDDTSDTVLRMLHPGIRHMPVVEDGKVIGMASVRDLLSLEVRSHGKHRTTALTVRAAETSRLSAS